MALNGVAVQVDSSADLGRGGVVQVGYMIGEGFGIGIVVISGAKVVGVKRKLPKLSYEMRMSIFEEGNEMLEIM